MVNNFCSHNKVDSSEIPIVLSNLLYYYVFHWTMTHFNFVISQNAKWEHAGFYIDRHRGWRIVSGIVSKLTTDVETSRTVLRPPIKNMRTGKYSFTKKALVRLPRHTYPVTAWNAPPACIRKTSFTWSDCILATTPYHQCRTIHVTQPRDDIYKTPFCHSLLYKNSFSQR